VCARVRGCASFSSCAPWLGGLCAAASVARLSKIGVAKVVQFALDATQQDDLRIVAHVVNPF